MAGAREHDVVRIGEEVAQHVLEGLVLAATEHDDDGLVAVQSPQAREEELHALAVVTKLSMRHGQ